MPHQLHGEEPRQKHETLLQQRPSAGGWLVAPRLGAPIKLPEPVPISAGRWIEASIGAINPVSMRRAQTASPVLAPCRKHPQPDEDQDGGEGDTQRHGRQPRLEPKAGGLRLYTHARAILRSIDDARADLLESQRAVTGEVAVGLVYSAVKAIGTVLARRVLKDHPGLRLSLTESLSGTTLLHLQSADVDMALVYNPRRRRSLTAPPCWRRGWS
ncbi:hypothetical protein [Paracoccus sp. S1E-3]|uniref:hypothetical protein n=1 Tax=Paracoccus sp. S1E-3 TaxID=2756130 RepID=UPI0015EED6B3|nr:hypothetical protein [Paracoccus sp. S1E-3]MBA4490207.1 hypothetical protein [Paracoccus sp. S1E-3]